MYLLTHVVNFNNGLIVVVTVIIRVLPINDWQALRVADAAVVEALARHGVHEGRLAARAGTARELRALRRLLQPVKLRTLGGRAVRANAGDVRIASARVAGSL